MCWCRRQSSIGFKLGQGAAKSDPASELPQASVGVRCRDQLQSRSDRLRDACTAGALRLFEEFSGNLYRDLARWFHDFHRTILNTSLEYGIPDVDEGVGTCGKDGQSVPVGVGIPTLQVDRLTVGGTGG